MFKARIKETGEIAEFSTGKNLHGETILLKVGTASFFKPEEVENIDQIGWRPASEKPIIPKDKEDIWVYCLVYGEDKDEKVLAPMFLRYTKLLTLGWVLPDDMIVVWWCYPPKND